MKPNFSLICRLLVVAIFFILFSNDCYSQSKDKLELKYKVESVKVDTGYQYSIEVKVKNGTGPFTYYLFQGEPWKGGQVVKEASNIMETTYTFKNLSKRNDYQIAVKGATKRDVNMIYVKL